MKTRVLTALVAIPLVLAVVGCQNAWPISILCVIAAAICGAELFALFGKSPDVGAIGSALVLAFPTFWPGFGRLTPEIAAGCFVLGAVVTLVSLRRRFEAGILGGFSLWTLSSLYGIVALHPIGQQWQWSLPAPLLLVLLPVWAGDSAAMLGGKAFGKHLLAPTISPKKTWEGAIANFIAAVLTGWGVGVWLGYETWVGAACGASVGVFGQFGDLFESSLKRVAGKKDSGTLLPGHGGLLDRIDALLASVIPVWLIAAYHFSP